MTVAQNKLGASIGVEITGMTGHELVDRQVADNTQPLLDEHGVVIYREVHIDDDDLLAFSRMLGKLVVQPTGEHQYREIQTITSDPAKTSAHGRVPQGQLLWHIDGSMDDVPQKGTLLTAREVDDADQGDTEFATTYAAYARSAARVVDATTVHAAPPLAPRRPRHLGQHRHAAPCAAIRVHLPPSHASHHPRRRGIRRHVKRALGSKRERSLDVVVT